MAKLPRPLAYRFVADDDAAFGQQLFHVAVAEVKAEIEPDGVADDLGGKAEAFVG